MPRSTGLAQPHQQRLLCGLGFHLNSCLAHRDTVNSWGGCDAERPPQLVLTSAFGHCHVHQKATLDQLSPPVPPNGFGRKACCPEATASCRTLAIPFTRDPGEGTAITSTPQRNPRMLSTHSPGCADGREQSLSDCGSCWASLGPFSPGSCLAPRTAIDVRQDLF